MVDRSKTSPSAFQDFAAGWLGGVSAVLVGHPFDTVKTRLQTDGLDGRKFYKGTFHCASHIIKTEGPLSLFKGMASPLIGVAALNAIAFGVQAKMLSILQPGYEIPTILNSFTAGAVAGGAQCVIACPMELIKLRMQMQTHHITFLATRSSKKSLAMVHGSESSLLRNKIYSSPWNAMKQIYRHGGVIGLNKGMVITLWREVPGFGLYFAVFDYASQWFMKLQGKTTLNDLSPVALGFSGGIAGVVSWGMVYPFDVIKSRIQVDGMLGEQQYKGIVDCFLKSYKKESVREFFGGFTITLFRSFLVEGAVFLTVALVLRKWRNTTR